MKSAIVKSIVYSIFFIHWLNFFPQTGALLKPSEKALEKYFKHDREAIYLHLNKATFVEGEEIWYKGYVYNRRNGNPYFNSTNINVYIYNSSGDIISKKLDLSINGHFHGNIFIDSSFSSGKYIIKAATNWMDNFAENDAYLQEINILKSEIPSIKHHDLKYNIRIVPEGGQLIENVSNSVGVSLINQFGQSRKIYKGELLNERNEIISRFSSNSQGFSQFSFLPKPLQKYKVRIYYDSLQKVESSFLKILPRGVSMKVDNLAKSYTKVTLSTNENTISTISEKIHTLLIHKDGQWIKKEFSFSKGKNELYFIFNRTALFKGMNTITLFDASEKPIAERLFFNGYQNEPDYFNFSTNTTARDSLKIKAKMLGGNAHNKKVSISILPWNAESYNRQHNIKTYFLLRPYLKNRIQNPSYYFINPNEEKRKHLDLLLIHQGWSRYSWDAIFNNPPIIKNEFENGIKIVLSKNGRKNKVKQLLIHQIRNSRSFIITPTEKSVELDRLFIHEDEKLRISAVGKNDELLEPAISIIEKTHFKEAPLEAELLQRLQPIKNNTPYEESLSKPVNTFNLFKDESTEKLDEIVVRGTSKKKERNGISIDEDIDIASNFIKKKTVKITQREVSLYGNVLDYIRSKGFLVEKARNGKVYIRTNTINTIQGSIATLVFYDDVPIDGSIDNFLEGLSMRNIEKILADKSGFGYGTRGANGVIKIYSRRTPLVTDETFEEKYKKRFISKKLYPSFSVPKIFYSPKYAIETGGSFEKFGVIYWHPNLILNNKNTAVITIKKPQIEELMISIEAMDKEGNLFSILKRVKLN